MFYIKNTKPFPADSGSRNGKRTVQPSTVADHQQLDTAKRHACKNRKMFGDAGWVVTDETGTVVFST